MSYLTEQSRAKYTPENEIGIRGRLCGWEESKKHAVAAVEECLEKMENTPGGSGAIYAVWDMKGFSGSNADLDLAKFCILDVFREYYPKRLSQVAAIDSPWAFKPVWAILKAGPCHSFVVFARAFWLFHFWCLDRLDVLFCKSASGGERDELTDDSGRLKTCGVCMDDPI